MKLTHLLILSFALLALFSCREEETNCRPDTYGIYSGTNGIGGTFEANVKEGAGEKGVIVVVTNKDASGSTTSAATAEGDLNESCTILNIPQQQLGSSQYSGNFTVTDTKLNGTFTVDGFTFPLQLTKQ